MDINFTADGWQECTSLNQLLDWHLGVVSRWAHENDKAPLAQRGDVIATNLKLRIEHEKLTNSAGPARLDIQGLLEFMGLGTEQLKADMTDGAGSV